MLGIDEIATGISMASGTVDLLSFAKSKIQTDYENFTKQLKKNIVVLCEQMRQNLNNTYEFRNLISEGIENDIYNTVIMHLKEGMNLSPRNLVTDMSVPENIRFALGTLIYQKLMESFEFSQRNYSAWIKQDTNEIKELANSLYKTLLEIYNEIVENDSAKQNNSIPCSKNRFHYSAETVDFLGRNDEISSMYAFCGISQREEKEVNNERFAWWAVTGAGGTGKSRLCFEFAKLMENEGWQICFPANHEYDKLVSCSGSLHRNTLFVLDYAENNIYVIGKWMETLTEERYNRIKIRVILIQRYGKKFDDIRQILGSATKTATRLENYAYNSGKFLVLSSPKNSIMKIQASYAKFRGITLSQNEANVLFSLLLKIDKKLLRPLYAIIIIDAYADDKEAPLNWNQKDALDYICNKELKFLEDSIKISFLRYQECQEIVDIGVLIKIFATMLSGLYIEKDLKKVLPKEKEFIDNLTNVQKELFYEIEELFSECEEGVYCPALEPDIIGEYFVIRYFWNHKHSRNYIADAWKIPNRMKLFVARSLEDHPAKTKDFYNYFQRITIDTPVIEKGSFEFSNDITDIIIGNNVKRIESCAFRGCQNIATVTVIGKLSKIGNSCFSNCQSLSGFMIKGKIFDIGSDAFNRCISLIEIKICNNLNNIGEAAFRNCINLETVYVDGDINRICTGAFFNCKKLKKIVVNGSIGYIDAYAFRGCKACMVIRTKGGVLKRHFKAFSKCKHYEIR